MLANSGGFFNLSSKWVIEQWRQLATSTYLAQELLWMYSTVTAKKIFAKVSWAFMMRWAVASSQKRQRQTEGNPRSWSSYKLQKSCQRTQRGPFYGLLAFAIWKAENAWKVGASWADCKSNKRSFRSVIFSYSTQQQQTISWSGCDVGWKVYFIWQPARPAKLDREAASKHFPKPNLHPKGHGHCLVSTAHLIHYSFLNPGETSTSEKMLSKSMRCTENCILQPALVNRKGPTLLHDSAWPHVTQPTLQKLNELGYKVWPRLPYSPNLSTTNYHFFKHLDSFLRGKCFHNQQEAENAFQEFVESWSTDFYATGMNKPISCWQKCVDCNGYYFDYSLIKMCLNLVLII